MTSTGDTNRATRVFLSYSRADEVAVIKLAADLEAAADVEVLRDKDDILPAEDWRARLDSLVLAADALVFCLSPAALGSREVLREVETAERLSKRIVPVVLRALQEPAPPSIESLNYIFLTDHAFWDEGVAKLRSAIHTNIGWIREHTRIGELAQRWNTGGRRGDDLLRGAALDAAEGWLGAQPRHAPAPSPLQREFVATGRAAAARRQRQWVTGSLVVAAVALGLSVVAYWQREIAVAQRTVATAERLSAEAQLTLADPLAGSETALLKLLVSLSLAPSAVANKALAAGVKRLQPRPLGDLKWPADAGELRALAFSQDGAWLGAVTRTEALFWDVRSRTVAGRYSLPPIDAKATLSFVPDGTRALVELRAAPTPDTAAASPATPEPTAAWAVIDLAKAQARTLTSADAFDVSVEGATILELEKTGTALPVIVDLANGTTIPMPNLAGEVGSVTFGRIFTLPFQQMMMLLPLPVPPITMPPMPMVLLLDDKGRGIMSPVGGVRGVKFQLPPTAQPFAFAWSGANAVLAVHRQNSTDEVISVLTAQPIWEAPHPNVHFLGFAANGRFMLLQDAEGARLETLGRGGSVRIESSRRTDYDLSTLTDLARYTPIISAEVAELSGQIVTAWKDGRIAVWEATQRPRYGGIGGMPMPSFEALARFDHGEEFGLKVGWLDPPSLFVAPTGRYVASQSMGIKTNPVGGVTAFDPLVRIWDSHHGGEVARFRPGGLMVAAFAPTDDILATAVWPGPRPDDTAASRSMQLKLWDLRERGPKIEETRQSGEITLTPPPVRAETLSGNARALLMPATMMVVRSAGAVWVGADLKVRALRANPSGIAVIDDLTSTLRESIESATADRERATSSEDADKSEQASVEELVPAVYAKPPPPEAPLLGLPFAVSGDGRRAILAVGSTVRLYALDEQPRLVRTFDLPPRENPHSAISGPVSLTISPDGGYFAVGLADPLEAGRSMNELGSAAAKAEVKVIDMKVLVFRADTAGPIQELSQTMLTMPPGLLRLRERLVALGPEARIGVIDETTITSDDLGRPQFAARLVVRNLMNGQERLTLPSRELHAQLFGSWETDGGADPVAAFDAKGTRLAVMRERPDCPMKVAVNMPISVPACAEHRIDLALWDLKRREQLAETNFIVGPDIRGGVSPLSTPSALAMKGIAGAGPTTPFSLVLRGPSLASIGSSEMRSVDVDGQQMLEVVLVHRLVSIEQDNAAVSAACERLPPDLTQIDRSTWMELAPNERFHSTCVPTGSTMTSPVSVGAQD